MKPLTRRILIATAILALLGASLFITLALRTSFIRKEMLTKMQKFKLELEDRDLNASLATKREIVIYYRQHENFFQTKTPIGFFVTTSDDALREYDFQTAAKCSSWAIDELQGRPSFPSEPHFK